MGRSDVDGLSLPVGSQEGTTVRAVVVGVLTGIRAVRTQRTRPEPVNTFVVRSVKTNNHMDLPAEIPVFTVRVELDYGLGMQLYVGQIFLLFLYYTRGRLVVEM